MINLRLLISIGIWCLILSCVSNKYSFLDKRNQSNYGILNLDGQHWLASNLKYETSNLNSYRSGTSSALKNSFTLLYDWESAKIACPEGWSLPDKNDLRRLIEFLSGTDNNSGGKIVNSKTLDLLELKFEGMGIVRNNQPIFIGQGTQEMWFTSSDTTWTDSESGLIVYSRIGIHYYPIGLDSFHIEPTYANLNTEILGYCRCIKQ